MVQAFVSVTGDSYIVLGQIPFQQMMLKAVGRIQVQYVEDVTAQMLMKHYHTLSVTANLI